MSGRRSWSWRLLLRLFPRAFRARWAGDLAAFWAAQRKELRYRGIGGRVRLAWHLVGDVATAVHLRLRRVRGPERPPGWRRGGGGGAWVTELRQACRALARRPAFTLVAAVTLSLGIGATTAAFAVVEQVLLRPLPYPSPDRLVVVVRTGDEVAAVSWPDFADWRASARGFAGLAAWTETDADFAEAEGAVTRRGARITADLFEVIGIAPQLGRVFTAQEDHPEGPAAVILSWGVWQDRFGGDVGAVGGTVRMNGRDVPVVGVMPRGFAYPAEADFWVPLREDELLAEAGLPRGVRTLAFLEVVGRLQAGVRVAAAASDLRALAARIDAEHLPADRPHRSVDIIPLHETMVADAKPTLVLILAAAGLVLLVACANAAGLAISRGAARGRELAVRAALGAGRGRLAGQLLAEGSALTVLAGVAGLGIGRAALGAIVRLAPGGVPRIDTLGLGTTAVAGWAAITALSGVLFAVGPALAGSRIAVGASEGLGTRSASAGRRELRPQRLLVVFQVALAVLLLAASVLLVRSYAGLRAVDPGYRIRGILTAAIAPPERGYAAEPARTEAFWRELLSRVRALPGVEAASSTYSAPLSGQEFRTTVVAEGDEEAEPLWAGSVPVRDDWFSTTGVPLLRGRDFTAADGPGAPDAAIVSETMARRLWPDSDPIGRRFRLTGGIAGALYDFDRQYFDDWLVVVGVAGDVRRTSLEAAPAPEYYRPHAQLPWPPLTLVVRTVGDPTALVGPLRDIVRRVDPEVPVQSVRTLRAQVGEALAEPRFRMLLVGAFGVVTALLAMVGLHAVTAIAVARRTREMGIRIALGATRHDIIARVLGDGLRLVAVGTAAGLAAALLVARTLASILFGISPGDPATYVAVTLATASVALLACLLPALRAGRTDPVRSIQAD